MFVTAIAFSVKSAVHVLYDRDACECSRSRSIAASTLCQHTRSMLSQSFMQHQKNKHQHRTVTSLCMLFLSSHAAIHWLTTIVSYSKVVDKVNSVVLTKILKV